MGGYERCVCFLLLQQLFRSVYDQWHRYCIWLKAFNVMLLAVWAAPEMTHDHTGRCG